VKGIIALAGTVAMALAGILSTTAAVSAPAVSAAPAIHHVQGTRNHPAVYSANADGSSSSQYKHGRLWVLHGGPFEWLGHPHFVTWNSREAVVTGALWGADSTRFSLGHNVTLVFARTDSRMGYHWFSHLRIKNSHGAASNYHMSRPSSRGNTWVPDACHGC
jgi:hypothetical protein